MSSHLQVDTKGPQCEVCSQESRQDCRGSGSIDRTALDQHQKLYMPVLRDSPSPQSQQSAPKYGNAVPLGLCGFAMTAFVLSWINAHTGGVTVPSIVVGSAYAYGGLIQLLAGMWEMAAGRKRTGVLHLFEVAAVILTSFRHFWCYCVDFIRWFLDILCSH